jgi:hypothetical protein
MAKAQKFGTFGGVFTPSILTILGVIMYLRLPWIAGQAGLYVTLYYCCAYYFCHHRPECSLYRYG